MNDASTLFEEAEDLSPSELFDQVQEDQVQSLPQRIGSNMARTAQSISGPVSSVGESVVPGLIETGLDTAKGVGQGLTMGASDEAGGMLGALAESAYNKFNPTDVALREQGFQIEQPDLTDLYRQNQQSIQKEFQTAEERSPWLNTAGQIAGGITSGSAIGGMMGIGGKAAGNAPKLLDIARNEGKMKALAELGLRGVKTYGQALPAIAVESALSSKEGGVLSPEERSKLTEDVVGGSLFGIPAVMGLQGITDVAAPLAREGAEAIKSRLQNTISETPLLRQMKVAYGYGKQGVNPKAQLETLRTDLGGAENLTQLDNTRTNRLVDEIYTAKDKIGQGVSDSLDNAEAAGKFVNIERETTDSLKQLQLLADRYPEIQNNPRAAQIFNKIATGETSVTPREAKDLIDYMDAYIGKFKSSTNTTPAEQGILSNLYSARQKFSNTLKTAIPEYGMAAERYNQFMKLVPETIIAGPRPVEIKGEFFGDMNKQDMKLFDQIKRLNQGTTREGQATQPIRESFVNTVKGLKTFEQQEAERLARGEIGENAFQRTADDIEREIKTNSDDAVARGAMDALEPHTGVATTLARTLTGTGETGRAMSLSAANIAGRTAKRIGQSSQNNPIAKISRGIYSAPHETVLSLSQKLKTTPGLEKYGQSLEEALNSPDSNRRNQVLFTIMQNPKSRAFVKDEHESMSQEFEQQP